MLKRQKIIYVNLIKTPLSDGVRIMSFFNSFFGKGKKETVEGYTEKNNRGTRIETYVEGKNYWNARIIKWGKTPQNMNNLERTIRELSKNPFVHFTFRTKNDAHNAMINVPFIHMATDSGRLVSTEPYDFGYYLDPTDKCYHAIIGGIGLSYDVWADICRIFQKFGGVKAIGNIEPIKENH